MNVGDYVKVTLFRGHKLDEPMWMEVVDVSEVHSYSNWWGGRPICGPDVSYFFDGDPYNHYDVEDPLGMSTDGKPDAWEVIGPEPPDEFFAAQAKFMLEGRGK